MFTRKIVESGKSITDHERIIFALQICIIIPLYRQNIDIKLKLVYSI